MTNAQMVFLKEQELAEKGVIKYTGRTFKAVNLLGEEVVVRETEPIHTYQAWKFLGFQVKKGSKAVAKFGVWKHITRKDQETGKEKTKMFMKEAAFFSASQVEDSKTA